MPSFDRDGHAATAAHPLGRSDSCWQSWGDTACHARFVSSLLTVWSVDHPIFYRATANAHTVLLSTSVCQTRALWQNEIIYCQNSYATGLPYKWSIHHMHTDGWQQSLFWRARDGETDCPVVSGVGKATIVSAERIASLRRGIWAKPQAA